MMNHGKCSRRTQAVLADALMTMGPQFELKLVENALHEQSGVAPYPFRAGQLVTRSMMANGRRPKPAKAKGALLPRGTTAEDAFRLTVLQCKWHIAANIPAIVNARDVEGLHQMRVALRRLRVALTCFGGEFRNSTTEALRLRAKQISERLALARDFDVFLDELFEPAATANGAKEAFDVLRARAKSARRTAWEDAVTQVQSPTFSAFLREIGEMIDQRASSDAPTARTHPNKGVIAFEMPAKDVAGRMLEYRLDQAKKHARGLRVLTDEQRHKLRITLKKLRYSAEFFAPLYSERAVRKFLKRLSRMQDVLGALNDVVRARETLETLVSEGDGGPLASRADLSFAAGIAYGWQLERAARTGKAAVGYWKKFREARPFWNS